MPLPIGRGRGLLGTISQSPGASSSTISSRRRCLNDPQRFCYVCGEYNMASNLRSISSDIATIYHAYFTIKLGDQDKSWAPHVICCKCTSILRRWYNGEKSASLFAVPMVWREPINHTDDCYFCLTKTSGFNNRNRHLIQYPTVLSAIRPVGHCEQLPYEPRDIPCASNVSESEFSNDTDSHRSSSTSSNKATGAHFITQADLNDLVRDLHLTKKQSEGLGSRLKQWNLLNSSTTFSWYRHREREFTKFYVKEQYVVHCCDIKGLIESMGQPYSPSDWRLFIDASKSSLKAVLLHNGNVLPSIPVAHSVVLKESYSTLKIILSLLKYKENQWLLCGDNSVATQNTLVFVLLG